MVANASAHRQRDDGMARTAHRMGRGTPTPASAVARRQVKAMKPERCAPRAPNLLGNTYHLMLPRRESCALGGLHKFMIWDARSDRQRGLSG